MDQTQGAVFKEERMKVKTGVMRNFFFSKPFKVVRLKQEDMVYGLATFKNSMFLQSISELYSSLK